MVFPRRTSSTAALAVLLLALGACGDDDDEPTSSAPAASDAADTPTTSGSPTTAPATSAAATSVPETTTATTGATATTVPVTTAPDGSAPPATAGDASTEVQVLDAGSEPRRELRFQLEEGSTSSVVMTATVGLEMTLGGSAVPIPELPGTRMTIDISVDEVTDDGGATYTFTFTELEAVSDDPSDGVATAMQNALDAMEGLSGTAQIDSRGRTISAEIDAGSVTDPALRAQFDQIVSQFRGLSVPFPEEPVGVGATWTATQQTTINGIETIAETTYELSELTDDGYTMTMTQAQTVAAGELDLPGLPAGATARVESSDITGSGDIQGVFAELIPEAQVTTAGEVAMVLTLNGEEQPAVQTLDVELVVERA